MHKRRAYTVIEIVIVIAIILILATLTAVSMAKARQRAKLTKVTTELTEIASSLSQYAEDNNYAYPPDANREVPPGLEPYLVGGVWPVSAWPTGVFDWDNWTINGAKVYQISYRLCDSSDPISACSDPVLFPNFVRNSAIFYCISGICVPHESTPTVPGYCINCKPKEQNY
jgi:prepilin-type N-terminal cleavage/methylation domain-containing protein